MKTLGEWRLDVQKAMDGIVEDAVKLDDRPASPDNIRLVAMILQRVPDMLRRRADEIEQGGQHEDLG